MKSRMLPCIKAATLLFIAMAMPNGMEAQGVQNQSSEHVRYKLIDLGTFGGPNSYVNGPGIPDFSNQGTYAGEADTAIPDSDGVWFCDNPGPACFVQHTQKWKNGLVSDLGALPGADNSSGSTWISANGRFIAGVSENGMTDPMLGVPEIRAVLWTDDGKIINLGTMGGGNESFAIGVNDSGQVTGVATNTTVDPYSMFCFVSMCAATETRSFLWQDGVKVDLGTLGGPDTFAYEFNERGQIAGFSYTNYAPNSTTGVPTVDPFFWDKGKMVDIGTLGGTYGTPYWINSRGQVIGSSNMAGDQTSHAFIWDREKGIQDLGTFGGSNGAAYKVNDSGQVIGTADFPGDFIHHAFVWKNGVMTDLGVVPGDLCSNGRAINSRGQAVGKGTNCKGVLQHLFLWENGVIQDLDALILPGSGVQFEEVWDIGDNGEIAAVGVLPNGDHHAVLLVPATAADIAEASALATSRPALAVSHPAAVTSVKSAFGGRNKAMRRFRGAQLEQ
jgi:probable HAF family extracellular repeat protein